MFKLLSLVTLGAAGTLGFGRFTDSSLPCCCTAAGEIGSGGQCLTPGEVHGDAPLGEIGSGGMAAGEIGSGGMATGEIGSGGMAPPDPVAKRRRTVSYLEARDITVWGGACHISGQAAGGGKHAVCAWDFGDARVVLTVQGDRNLQGHAVFNNREYAEITTEAWTDVAEGSERDAIVARAMALAPDLPAPRHVTTTAVTFEREGEAFELHVAGVVELSGTAVPDRACCSMPESRWYAPMAVVPGSIVGQADRCKVKAGALADWAFEGENSVFLSPLGS